MKKQADIGLIGLAVMGENLVLNMESKGYTVAVFNRTVEKVDKFISGRGAGKNFIGTHSIEEFVKSLSRPRKVMLLEEETFPFMKKDTMPQGIEGRLCIRLRWDASVLPSVMIVTFPNICVI